jgi:hypothetical protein
MPPVVTLNYVGLYRTKYFVARYLTSVLKANEKGLLLFTDGTNKIEFSRTPVVSSVQSWVSRDIPAVLIGPTSATYLDRTFAKNLLKDDAALDDTKTKVYYGGDLDIEMTLFARAVSLVETDNLTDVVSIFFSKKEAKDYFLMQDIKIPKPPRVGPTRELLEPALDYPLYETPIELTFRATWVEWTEIGDRLIDIIVNIDAELDL